MKTNPSLKLFQRAVAAALAIVIASGLSVRSAQAGYIVTLEQVGPNVVATGSGAFDLTGLFFFFNASILSQIGPPAALIYTGPTTVQPVTLYNGLSGPTSFGTGGATFASSGIDVGESDPSARCYKRHARGDVPLGALGVSSRATQAGQVYRSTPGRDDVGSDLLHRYDVTSLRGSDGKSAHDNGCHGCRYSEFEDLK